jgi:two-component system, chemotaxis family, protein-glutamate methylesterase/glutaminase
MAKHDIVVIGASAGGVEALQELVKQLPADFPASVFVVLHIPARSRSYLPELLSRSGRLRAVHPADGEPIQPGRIYVAPPDHHLIVEKDHVHLSMGPKEQHHRPCINVLFRSAALAYGERVAGVVLTGELDDGTAGLWEVSRRGGVAVVQNPETAAFPSMPLSALREVEAEYVANLDEMGSLLTRLASNAKVAEHAEFKETHMAPHLTDLTCPDCRGTIWEIQRERGSEFRCRVGHTFSPLNMLSGHFAVEEKALYQAIVALEEGASLANRLAERYGPPIQERLQREATDRLSQASRLRQLLGQHTAFVLD